VCVDWTTSSRSHPTLVRQDIYHNPSNQCKPNISLSFSTDSSLKRVKRELISQRLRARGTGDVNIPLYVSLWHISLSIYARKHTHSLVAKVSYSYSEFYTFPSVRRTAEKDFRRAREKKVKQMTLKLPLLSQTTTAALDRTTPTSQTDIATTTPTGNDAELLFRVRLDVRLVA
jgi:hypothetical protein